MKPAGQHAPLPLRDWPLAQRAGIRGVITDIDDTLTDGGAIQAPARQALAALQRQGIPVLATTGRPVGWSKALLMGENAQAPLPLLGIVAENGAVALQRNNLGELGVQYRDDDATRAAHFARLQAALSAVEACVPGALRATDSWGRETDIAIDHSEHRHLPPEKVEAVRALLQDLGLKVSVSSTHVNAGLGEHNKWTGAQWALDLWLGQPLSAGATDWLYIGDSSNDEAMFQHLPQTVGVANIQAFLPRMAHPPRYICQNERGDGFAEMVAALEASRI